MGNILNHNFNNLKLQFKYDEYWDFFVCLDNNMAKQYYQDGITEKCLISYIDMENPFCISGTDIQSNSKYAWESAITTSDYTLTNIGLTGFDNGLIQFRKDRITNDKFVDLYLNSEYKVSEEPILKLHQVSGCTLVYDYPMEFKDGEVELDGGFFQGFFQTECDKYDVLPVVMENGDTWHLEFVLKKEDLEEKRNTLNSTHPNNKGIFFYIGTRAENKWIYEYDDSDENDSCKVFSTDNYIEGTEINKKNFGIIEFLDMHTEFICHSETPDYWIKTVNEIGQYVDLRTMIVVDEKSEDFFDLFNDNDVIDDNKKYLELDDWTNAKYPEEIKLCGECEGPSLLNNEMDIYLSDSDDVACFLDGDDQYDYVADDIDITDFDVETDTGINVKINGLYYIDTDNKFLTFDRTCNGFNVHNWEEGDIVRYYGRRNGFQGNLFLIMNRTCTGYNVNNIDEYRNSFKKEYNIYKDLYNNALAFRITDEGAIGYRYLTIDCDSETQTTIKEAYSFDGVIKEDEWTVINVAIHASNKKMKMYFYVNGKLVFVTDELDKLNLRALDEIYEKQETVPFNISIGGGTQGLADVILPNYMIEPYRIYPLEENFAGTFIGSFKSFKFYNCNLNYELIRNNFAFEKSKLR